MSYATLEHYKWQMPRDKNTTDTSTSKSWNCSSGIPKSTYAYYTNSADKADSCDPNCTGYCSPICTGPTTPGGYDTPDLVCNNVKVPSDPPGTDSYLTLKCDGIVSTDAAKCQVMGLPLGTNWTKGCNNMIALLQNSVDDKGNAYLDPGATCAETQGSSGGEYILGCSRPGNKCHR